MSANKLVAAALATTALVAAGCGGSSKTATVSSTTAAQPATTAQTAPGSSGGEIAVSSGKPLSRTVWIRRGDAICSKANIALSSTTAKSTADFARLLPQAAAYEHTEASELSKLVPPTAMASDWQQIVADLQKYSEFSVRAGEYAQTNNFQAATPVAQAGNKVQIELVALAKRDGFKVCSIP